MLYIKEANYDDIEQEWQFVRSMPVDENGLTNPYHNISKDDFEQKALPEMIGFAKGENLPEGYVPVTYFFLWSKDVIVGQFRVRHYLTDALRAGAGHIGYFIAKEYRGQGFATEGLRLTLDVAKHIIPEKEFYLRVNKDNPASLQVMLKNGGTIVEEDKINFYVRIHKPIENKNE